VPNILADVKAFAFEVRSGIAPVYADEPVDEKIKLKNVPPYIYK
jgi:hypothetical protein